jgi:hypothetical protein
MRSRRRNNRYVYFLIAGILLLGVCVFVFMFRKQPTPITVSNTVRERYAALYEAAWRQDDGRDPILTTATLLVAPTITLLGQDTERSVTEEQIWNSVRSLDARVVPVVVTIDSVTGTVTDDAMQQGLQLTTDRGPQFTLSSWQPLVAGSRIVNSAGASAQIGIALFRADRDIDWSAVGAVTLTLSGIGDTKERIFSWTEPSLLLQL